MKSQRRHKEREGAGTGAERAQLCCDVEWTAAKDRQSKLAGDVGERSRMRLTAARVSTVAQRGPCKVVRRVRCGA